MSVPNAVSPVPSGSSGPSAAGSSSAGAGSSSAGRPRSAGRARAARLAVVSGAAAVSVLLLSGTAAAHVSVQPQGEAAKGGYATVSFKVPNERDNASTVKLEVSMPAGHPLASVLPQPVPGWKVEVTRAKLVKPLEVHGRKITEAVARVTWTADGGKIGPGQFQQFPLSIGQLPENADRLVFKAVQTYDNKEVVRWIEEPREGGAEPSSPAPVLELSAPAGDGHSHGDSGDKKNDAGKGGTGDKDGKSGTPAAGDAKTDGHGHDGDGGEQPASGSKGSGDREDAKAAKDTASAGNDGGTDTTARVLGVIGILVGVAGVAFGVLAGRRRATS
jgi:periplasmic copper chaperone A